VSDSIMFGGVTLDCPNAGELAAFYAEIQPARDDHPAPCRPVHAPLAELVISALVNRGRGAWLRCELLLRAIAALRLAPLELSPATRSPSWSPRPEAKFTHDRPDCQDGRDDRAHEQSGRRDCPDPGSREHTEQLKVAVGHTPPEQC